MHLIHTKHKCRGKFRFICDSRIILKSSVHDIQRFCDITNSYIDINNGTQMTICPEKEK